VKEFKEGAKLISKDDKTSTYEINTRLGYGPGDMAAEWWTQEDWDNHSKYIEELKANNEYMKPVTYEMTLMRNPRYDDNFVSSTPVQTYRIDIIDFSK
jgi:hypothetical protein